MLFTKGKTQACNLDAYQSGSIACRQDGTTKLLCFYGPGWRKVYVVGETKQLAEPQESRLRR